MSTAARRLRSLLRQVRELELIAERNVSSRLSGNYLTTYRGTGLDFHEARKYVQGESIRRIDWRMTARMREPYVQVHNEERLREVIVAVDVSSSMRGGWQERTKLETAIETAATLAVAAVRSGDKLGFVTYSDRVHAHRRPRAGRRALYAFLRELIEQLEAPAERSTLTDARSAIHWIQRLRLSKMVVFLVSDFHESDLGEDLRFLGRRHDTTLVRIVEPLEESSPPPTLRRRVISAEGAASTPMLWRGRHLVARSDSQPVPSADALYEDATRSRPLHHIELETTGPVGSALHRAFHLRGRRRSALGTRSLR